MVAFKTSYGVIQQSLFYSPIYSNRRRRLHADQPAAGPRADAVLQVTDASVIRRSVTCVASVGVRTSSLLGRRLSRALGLPPPPPTTPSAAACACRCATASNCSPTTTRPLTPNPAGTLLVRGPVRPRLPVLALFGARLRRARLPRPPAERARHVRVGRRVRARWSTRPTTAPTPSAWLRDQPWFTGSFATIGLSYLGFTQWALLTDPPPELAAAVITVGPARLQRTALGHRVVLAQRLPRLERHGRPPGGPGPDPRRRAAGRGQAAAGTRDSRPAARRGRPRPARRRRAVVRVVARTPRARRPVLGRGLHLHDRAGSRRGSRCCCSAAGRTCSSTRPWSSTAQLRDRGCAGRADRRLVDAQPHDDQGCADRPARIAGLARHPPGGQPRQPTRSPVRVHVNRDGWLDLPTGRPPCPSRCCTCSRAAVSATRCRPTPRRRRRSPTTPPTRPRPSAAGCCPPRAATATTPSCADAPTC